MRLLLTLVMAGVFSFAAKAQEPGHEITFTSFSAIAHGSHVLLSWQAESKDVISYDLQKSKNGSDYDIFGTVQAGDLAGMEFMETDFAPAKGLSWYRLRMTNMDGSVTYSNTVPVKYDDNMEPVSPVAATNSYNTAPSDSSVLIIVQNAAGEEFYSMVDITGKGNPMECADLDPALSSGTYTIVGCSRQEFYSRQVLVK
ncbi:MAG TPA: hypothetical protein VFU15_04860 [Bacteroidia bacterium]|nr:hypothetical protein [Bacteroidia bacterium]